MPQKTIEEKYQKKNLHEHILHSPDTYIGSIEDKTCHMWIYNENAGESDAKMIYKEITYVPGFYKICDEILVNAADHSNRCKTCNKIKINIDQESGKITVWNNGDGIDVVEHKKHNILVPSMLFCDLLTSTNYDKNEEKTVGGKNGFGAKLANIYSTEFIIETLDAKRDLNFVQHCSDNMYKKDKPKVSSGKGKSPYTRVSFVPDFNKFGLDGITDDMIALLKKRSYDLAMTTKASVYFNNEKITQNNFTKYIDLYFPENSVHEKAMDITTNDRWKICVIYDQTDQLEHQNISFVNSICTSRGGTHVDQIIGQIVRKLIGIISKKIKGIQLKPGLVKENLIFFIDSTIVNPDFDTQTKECLTTKSIKFGSNFVATDSFIKRIIKTGVVDQIIANAKAKAEASLSKTDGKGRGVLRFEKLYDAHNAGIKNGYNCTLILTEGDSAKTMALSGVNVIGRDYYGIFPLRGKLLNVREATFDQLQNNEEIIAIKKIVGLEQGKVYKDTKGLRYGSILVLTDQDSVTNDTPLLLKNDNGQIEIRTIDNISSDWTTDPNGKEYSNTNYQVWTETGWTNIRRVMRHKVNKPIYRILTDSGAVDVTKDHSLLDPNSKKISPKECTVGTELLHNFPNFKNDNKVLDDNGTGISKCEAYVMGLFWANGTCIENWSITNTNISFLEESKKILENYYDFEFKIIEYDASKFSINSPCYRLIINDGKYAQTFIDKYRTLFCDKNNKSIPPEILNASYGVRENFFNGCYDGNGCKYHILESTGSKYFYIDGKIGAHGLYFLCKSLGYNVSINHNIDKPNTYILTLTREHQQNNPDTIKKIFKLEDRDQYVYDLETENHHFQAGIGRLIVHNTDGFHIKGLIMNFIHFYWPSLIKQEGFIRSLATPLLKASRGKNKKNVIEFTNEQEFEEWKNENNNGKGWNIKYYKGLGTSTPKEAQEYFTDLDEKLSKYYWETKKQDVKKIIDKSEETLEEDDKNTTTSKDITTDVYKPKLKDISEDAFRLAFSKEAANDRKVWINMHDAKNYIDSKSKRISYYDFFHRELISFSVEDVKRSIPHIMDGFKPSQRKVYYGSIKENIYKREIKVSDLAGSISKNTQYHHGEASMTGTIVGMAQNYVGSNNINLLMPNGQFGSRLCGGKDHASPRYIHTQLDELGKKIFIDRDYDILVHQREDNTEIEPLFYAPIIPMILVNGSTGIGTGYSTEIPPCNPHSICLNLKRILAGEKPKTMKPWYRHFTGTIKKIDDDSYVSRANYDIIDDNTIHINDLPIGIWTDNYKAFLNKLLNEGTIKKTEDKKSKAAQKKVQNKSGSKTNKVSKKGSKKSKYMAKKNEKSSTAKVSKKNPLVSAIKTYKEDCTEIRISFTIEFHPNKLKTFIKNGTLEKNLKLVSSLKLTNMHLFNEHNKIIKYKSYGSILKNFSKIRLELYQTRKDFLLDKWEKEMEISRWRLAFIEHVIDKKIIIFNKKINHIIEQLEEFEFPMLSSGDKAKPSYEYLTSTSILKFSKDEVEKLRKQLEEQQEDIDILRGKTPAQIWDEELDIFMEAYDIWDAKCFKDYNELMVEKKGSKKLTKKKTVAKKKQNQIIEKDEV